MNHNPREAAADPDSRSAATAPEEGPSMEAIIPLALAAINAALRLALALLRRRRSRPMPTTPEEILTQG